MQGSRSNQPRLTTDSDRTFRSVRLALPLAALLLAMISPTVQGAYEQPPVLQASEMLPPAWIHGPHHRIESRVPTDGFLSRVTVRSDYGPFEVRGPGLLGIRLREIDALAALDRLAHESGFVTGVKDSARNTGENLQHLAVDTGATVAGLPGGIRQFFGRTFRSAKTSIQSVLDRNRGITPGALPGGGPGSRLPGGNGGDSPAATSRGD